MSRSPSETPTDPSADPSTDETESRIAALPEVYLMRDLAQVKALADPLRVRILEALIEQPRTTKQVAEHLGEKPTKLYHHVDALEKAELIALHSTRPNRGTLEKYYRAVARLFRADPALFGSEPEGGWAPLGADLLAGAVEELRTLNPELLGESKPMIVQAKITAREDEIEALQKRLETVLEDFAAERLSAGDERRPEDVDYRLTVALYPIRS